MTADIHNMLNHIRDSEQQIEQQQETIDNLEKLCDQHVKQAIERDEKVSILRKLIRV